MAAKLTPLRSGGPGESSSRQMSAAVLSAERKGRVRNWHTAPFGPHSGFRAGAAPLLTYKSQASARACRCEAEVVQVLAIVKAAQMALSTVAQHGHDRLSCKAKNRQAVILSRTCDTHPLSVQSAPSVIL